MTPFEKTLKYHQLKEEVAFYKSEVTRKNWRYFGASGLVFAGIFLLLNFLNKVLWGEQTISNWVQGYAWWELPIKALGWVIVFYFWQVRSAQKKLTEKTKELHRLLLQDPSLEKAAA